MFKRSQLIVVFLHSFAWGHPVEQLDTLLRNWWHYIRGPLRVVVGGGSRAGKVVDHTELLARRNILDLLRGLLALLFG